MFFANAQPHGSFTAGRIFLEDVRPREAGIVSRHPIEAGSWIWHPDAPGGAGFFLFRLEFEARAGDAPLLLHLSADQRFEVALDGQFLGAGPEAAPATAYSFHSWRIENLETGKHVFEIFCWHLGVSAHLAGEWTKGTAAPLARETVEPGFILAAEGDWAERLSTGQATWQVCPLPGLDLNHERHFQPAFGIGNTLRFDARTFPWEDAARDWKEPVVLHPPFRNARHGELRPRWRLLPARLPEMLREPINPGRVVAVVDDWVNANGWDEPLHAFTAGDAAHEAIPEVQEFWDAHIEHDLQIEPGTALSILVDLGDYFCGYPEVICSGGRDAELCVDWCEGLIEAADGTTRGREHQKGNRNEFVGKVFRGLNDTFFADGGGQRHLVPHWWRAGRYVLIRVRAAEAALTLHRIQILETRYPYAITGTFTCDQDEWIQPVLGICRRGLEMCSHETYMDCPFYEQLMYVFDTRLEVLTTYALTADARLPRRALELFDISRERYRGGCCSRFPCREDQLIPMFSMAWTWMIADYLFWRGEADWLRGFLPGARATHDWFEHFENADGLLENLPGWPFGDWVAGWERGVPASGREGVSAIFNLVHSFSLRQMALLEEHLGDPARVAVYNARADRIAATVRERFWDAGRGLFADDDTRSSYSQQAQIWALLGGLFAGDEAGAAALLEKTLAEPDLWPTSYFFRSLLFDVMARHGRGGEILDQLGAWREMVETGARTGFEHQEPTRSDCHAWSSHPAYHLPASILGIRPAAPGFARVEVRPQPGPLAHAAATMPHPRGEVRVDLSFADSTLTGEIQLPEGIEGSLYWQGEARELSGGLNRIGG